MPDTEQALSAPRPFSHDRNKHPPPQHDLDTLCSTRRSFVVTAPCRYLPSANPFQRLALMAFKTHVCFLSRPPPPCTCLMPAVPRILRKRSKNGKLPRGYVHRCSIIHQSPLSESLSSSWHTLTHTHHSQLDMQEELIRVRSWDAMRALPVRKTPRHVCPRS
ncbi:hypothetical protein CDEST_03726 [Colletotrichum destructivum]|uniref:Uncharacterized protein n=1 Tax=Colletotrichum destructivum TaxID=34406 RepID=A0AAX4I5P7_9PEZI|nr:hypothetical protein CDEST_03726 [Colletotrichum destructivum]